MISQFQTSINEVFLGVTITTKGYDVYLSGGLASIVRIALSCREDIPKNEIGARKLINVMYIRSGNV